MGQPSDPSEASVRHYTRAEVAEAARASYAQVRHWQEAGLLRAEAVPDGAPAAPGAVQYLFPERSLRLAVHIAELRRAGISLQAIAQLLQFIEGVGPQPLFLSAGDQPALVLVSPKAVGPILGLLRECSVIDKKEVQESRSPHAVQHLEWQDHSSMSAFQGSRLRRSQMEPTRLNRRAFLRVAALSATAALGAACGGPTAPTSAPDEPTPTATAMVTTASTAAVEPTAAATVAASKYGEAPMLAEMVAAGELPPISERLPKEPRVIPVTEEIGQYGGTWHACAPGLGEAGLPASRLCYALMVRWAPDGNSVIPHVAKSYEISDDSTEFTFHLRDGMKWSDGEPFTADDIVFWYEDILLNADLYPTFPKWLCDPQHDEPMLLEKLDDYSFAVRFKSPYGLFIQMLASPQAISMTWAPKHYLSQFHPKYADPASLEQMVSDAGFDNWWELFGSKGGGWDAWQNPECPQIWPWIPSRVPPDLPVVYERNPYYWCVDPEGNQLPYIDNLQYEVVEKADLLNLRAVAGELDMQDRHILHSNYPLLVENAQQGEYRILKWVLAEGSNALFMLNHSHRDPVMRELIANKDFRIALSHGINRSEVNELAYQGMGEPRQAELIPQCPYYKEERAAMYAEYDPDKSEQLLDAIGLTNRDGDGLRLRPDGQPLSLAIEYAPVFGPWRDTVELVCSQWQKIGIRAIPKEEDATLFSQRGAANEQDVGIWTMDRCFTPLVDPLWWIPGSGAYSWAPEYGQWYETRGAQGTEPPEEIRLQFELYDKIKAANQDELPALAEQFFDHYTERLWLTGAVGVLPQLVVVKNNFRNVPEEAVSDWLQLAPGNTNVEQYFKRS